MNWLIIAEILTVIGAFVSVVATVETILHMILLRRYMAIVISEKEEQVKRDKRNTQVLESLDKSLKILAGDMLMDRKKIDEFFRVDMRNIYHQEPEG